MDNLGMVAPPGPVDAGEVTPEFTFPTFLPRPALTPHCPSAVP
jgi:hypothetical protein